MRPCGFDDTFKQINDLTRVIRLDWIKYTPEQICPMQYVLNLSALV